MSDSWIERFPELAALPPQDRAFLTERAAKVALPAGTTVFAPGVAAESFLLILAGTVRVQQVSPGGREIVLYRVTGGETCIMTTSCLLADENYAADGVTETDVEAVAIPKAAFEEAIAQSPGFRRLVFTDYSRRISDLMHVVEEVAFERLDKRLAQRLLARADNSTVVRVTHQDLATDLGSAREVVGRLLKELERRGWVALSRGAIELRNPDQIKALAEGS
ncbi:Crp/Fnr family transcriptional regulator [Denitrobaculum tricleocarpae]|uniref:Crp/Fnr family transcriptional regulator n=1 Tax=Denitrobaculum tricleocarpae TaxID=2591009 RepID=A0A545TUK7_9PROT|nr:Crp/Fnr family transcriptional regulator [Denitrobaculum tricleocarpae]TQV80896.1 Crp/Fnr family transcriptional regulator [Denitrobaculum tricleocarpae]